MKLLAKTTYYYLLVSLLFFATAGVLILYNYRNIIDEDVNSFLINREEIATTQIVNNVPINALNNYEQIIKKVAASNDIDNLKFKDTTLYDIIDDEFHTYRKLEVNRKIGRQNYNIVILKSLIESNILIKEVLTDLVGVFMGLLVFLILGNIFISRNLWKPFKNSLAKLEDYELGSRKSVDFETTTIHEFNQLNSILNVLIKKIRYDYLNLKEFTENAAHEIQTPLAIIRAKSEFLLQSATISPKELEQIKSIYDSCLRLSKINRGLSLLAKIESGLYGLETVNVTEILKAQVDHYNEVITLNKLIINTQITHNIYHSINTELVEILISNLLRNSIKHNIENGAINIQTAPNSIHITNTGNTEAIDASLFKRFNRSNTNSLGLGLSIIAKICRIHKIKLDYSFSNNKHHFKLIF